MTVPQENFDPESFINEVEKRAVQWNQEHEDYFTIHNRFVRALREYTESGQFCAEDAETCLPAFLDFPILQFLLYCKMQEEVISFLGELILDLLKHFGNIATMNF